MEATQIARLDRARVALEGLAVGDAFGETFFVNPAMFDSLIAQRALETPPWEFTDDTNMALSIFSNLRQFGKIEQTELAHSFAQRYDPGRGYGPAMHKLMDRINQGEAWREAAGRLFVGQGSFGNGAAMRVAPLGAFFADELDLLVKQAALSAEITHAHPEGIAGAIAVGLAAAWAWRFRENGQRPAPADFIRAVLPQVPASEVKRGLEVALTVPDSSSIPSVVSWLGNGVKVSAQDTVPFALWCAAQRLDNYEEALWLTVSGQGDRDTNCAIVGGIVASYTGPQAIPTEWLTSREELPAWPFEEPV